MCNFISILLYTWVGSYLAGRQYGLGTKVPNPVIDSLDQFRCNMQLLFACIFSTLTIHAVASPTLKERQQSVCAYPDAPLISSCWDELDIPDYLINWSRNVPIRTGFRYSNDSCFAGEGWSSCFIRLGWEQVVGIVDCSTINQTDCKFPSGSLRDQIAPGTAQQVKYVTSSVVNVYGLFQSLYQGEPTS